MIIDAEIQVCPAFGWMSMPEFKTRIVSLRSGRERRNQTTDQVRHRFVLPFQNIEDQAYLLQLKGVFLACRGQLRAFLAKDYSDYRADAEFIGSGDGIETEFQLRKIANFGGETYERIIRRPVNAVVTVNGTTASASIDTQTGIATLDTAPAEGAIIRWSGEFRVPVRFDSDVLPMSIDNRVGRSGGYAMNGSIELVEVWE